MAQLCTATFITASGFATWLTPTVTINEALTGTLVGTFDMTETSTGNYVYDYEDANENLVYFFKYDAASATVINRYMGSNNNIETQVNIRGGWGSAVYNNVISKDKIQEIADMVVKSIPKQKEITLDTSKIEETLGSIVTKIDEKETIFDYGRIISWQEINTQKIIKKVESIKIPKQDDTKIMEAIDAIKNIPEPDLSCMDVMDKKIDWVTAKFDWLDRIINIVSEESKAMEALKKVKAQLWMIGDGIESTTSIATNDRIKEIDPNDMNEMMKQDLENNPDFKSLVNENEGS